MKKAILKFIVLSVFSFLFPLTLLADRQETIDLYKTELVALGLEEEAAGDKAESEVDSLLSSMEGTQADMEDTIKSLNLQVKSLANNDDRSDEAQKAMDKAKDYVKAFAELKAQDQLEVQPSIGGSIPRVIPSSDFDQAEETATEAIGEVRRVLIAPSRPGNVPTGKVEDFLSQVIRQLYRFAWVAILISFIVSGVLMIVAQDNEERLTKAKGMIYQTLIGFTFIVLTFAIVKAVTDIDFFNFI